MTTAPGKNCYSLGSSPVTGAGLEWTALELETAISGSVAGILFDDQGKATVSDLLAGIADTEFERSELDRILSDTSAIEDWRVGEAIAEAYLSDHKDCHFPWPDGRD